MLVKYKNIIETYNRCIIVVDDFKILADNTIICSCHTPNAPIELEDQHLVKTIPSDMLRCYLSDEVDAFYTMSSEDKKMRLSHIINKSEKRISHLNKGAFSSLLNNSI